MLITMKSIMLMSVLALASLGAAQKVNEPAPQFSLTGTDGATISLKDYAGKSKVVLVFYRGSW